MIAGVAMADTVLSTWLLRRLSALLDAPSPVIVDAVVSATDCVAESALTSTFGQLLLVALWTHYVVDPDLSSMHAHIDVVDGGVLRAL